MKISIEFTVPLFIKKIIQAVRAFGFQSKSYRVTYSIPKVPHSPCGEFSGSFTVRPKKRLSNEKLALEIYDSMRTLISSVTMIRNDKSGFMMVPIIYYDSPETPKLTCTVVSERNQKQKEVFVEIGSEVERLWIEEYQDHAKKFAAVK